MVGVLISIGDSGKCIDRVVRIQEPGKDPLSGEAIPARSELAKRKYLEILRCRRCGMRNNANNVY